MKMKVGVILTKHWRKQKKTGGGDSYALDEREEMPLSLSGNSQTAKPPSLHLPYTIARQRFEQSLSRLESNNFLKRLQVLFCNDTATQIAKLYYLGTSQQQPGARVFWQVDTDWQIRTGKVLRHDPATGQRIQQAQDPTVWVHEALGLQDYQFRQCLFGLHLLARYPDKPVGIVLREESAIVLTVFWAEYVWIALGEIGNLTADRFEPLKGRVVVLFPDLGNFEQWQTKVGKMDGFPSLRVSDHLERNAPIEAMQNGYYVADLLLNQDRITGHALTAEGYPTYWDYLMSTGEDIPVQSQSWMGI
jgi:hypothetical protein